MKGRALLCALLVSSTAYAATPAEERRDRLFHAYRSCVLGAAADLARTGNNLQIVAEQAFLACATEEQAIRALFGVVGSPPAIAESAIVRAKLDLKNIITLQQ